MMTRETVSTADNPMRLTPEESEFVANNFPLAIDYAVKHARGKPYFDDFLAEAARGLVHAVKKYIPGEYEFSTYADHWMRHYTSDMIHGLHQIRVPAYLLGSAERRKSRKLRFQKHADDIMSCKFISRDSSDESRERIDMESNHKSNVDFMIDIKEIVRRFPVRDQEIFFRRLHGDTLDSIAESSGMSKERVRQIQSYTLKKIRRILRKEFA